MQKTMRLWVALAALLGGSAVAQPPGLPLISYQAPAVPRLLTDGTAIVAYTVRANGRVEDAVALAASAHGLGDAARDAVLIWRFERDPVLGTGRDANPSAIVRRELVEFVFKRDGVVTSLSHAESARTWLPGKRDSVIRLLQSEDLDTPLVRLAPASSAATAALVAALPVGGRVIVSFVVDESGRVRVPAIVAVDDPALAQAALAVVRDWRYEPPTHGGDPVLVETSNALTFRPRSR